MVEMLLCDVEETNIRNFGSINPVEIIQASGVNELPYIPAV